MNMDERLELLMQCKKLRIRNRELAQLINKSDSWLSQWFNKSEISLASDDLATIKNYISSKQEAIGQ